jgi:4-carboxymuconolactone decarboxylase
VLSAALLNKTVAQDAPIFPKGEISTTDNHTGTVWLKELNVPDSIFNLSLAHATFAPGAKLDWHIHPAGQYLLITSGTGYYQEKGKPIQIVHQGDVIKCLPGVEHWHGAAPGSSFSYIGATPTQKGKTIWAKRVTNEEYNSIKAPATNSANAEQEIINLSKQKWKWMSDKNVDSLNVPCLFTWAVPGEKNGKLKLLKADLFGIRKPKFTLLQQISLVTRPSF